MQRLNPNTPTKRIRAAGGEYEFFGTVAADADLDGMFTLVSADDGQSYRLNGWLYSIDVLEG